MSGPILSQLAARPPKSDSNRYKFVIESFIYKIYLKKVRRSTHSHRSASKVGWGRCWPIQLPSCLASRCQDQLISRLSLWLPLKDSDISSNIWESLGAFGGDSNSQLSSSHFSSVAAVQASNDNNPKDLPQTLMAIIEWGTPERSPPTITQDIYALKVKENCNSKRSSAFIRYLKYPCSCNFSSQQ